MVRSEHPHVRLQGFDVAARQFDSLLMATRRLMAQRKTSMIRQERAVSWQESGRRSAWRGFVLAVVWRRSNRIALDLDRRHL